jgi:predicted AlkP superfamily pyrophosphatase or phosphodiesterase
MTSSRVVFGVVVLAAGVAGFGRGFAARATAFAAQPNASHSRAPRLVVLLMVDQFRGDYVARFRHQWTRGLHRLLTEGAWFRQARYPYYNTVTCAGHATVSTGSIPAVHGMILNSWFDRTTKSMVTCTEDSTATAISYGRPLSAGGESLIRLRTTTLADELQAQLSPRARVIAFSLKARSAIPLAGRHPAATTWFDDSGSWVTSTAFTPKPVPEVAEFIKQNPIERDATKTWTPSLPKDEYLFESPTIGISAIKGGMTPTFPHALSVNGATDSMFYDRWQSSPWADEYLARMALETARQLEFGARQTDMIGISFSTLDKVGHDYGPNSHEVQDVLIRLDRTLGDLFAGFDRLVGAGNYTVALTADHGVAPFPERALEFGSDAGRLSPAAVVAVAERAVAAAFGSGNYVSAIAHTDLYFQPTIYDRLRAQPPVLESVRRAIMSLPGVLKVYTADDLMRDAFDDDPMGRQLAHSYMPGRSGDLTFTQPPYWIVAGTGANHGTGYDYDTHVPVLLMGKGIAKGEYLGAAAPTDVAPTLAFLANVTLPQPNGRVLIEALTR